MPQYKLIYFNLRARGELIRLLFEAAGVEYEDFRVEHSRWPDMKKDTPFGQLPILEIDGSTKLCQSLTIARYVANKYGLAGKTELEKARADMIVDCIDDVSKEILKAFLEKDETKKKELKETLEKEKLPEYFQKFEEILKQNNNGDGYFAGDALTWADISFANGIAWTCLIGFSNPIEKLPKLTALVKKVESHPKIEAWIKKRPNTLF